MDNTVRIKHTPTPWTYTGTEDQDFVIWGPGKDQWLANVGEFIQEVGVDSPQEHANAEFIVRAVNSHDELVGALNMALSLSDSGDDGALEVIDKINAVLKKVEG